MFYLNNNNNIKYYINIDSILKKKIIIKIVKLPGMLRIYLRKDKEH
jgi:hypothetical protein